MKGGLRQENKAPSYERAPKLEITLAGIKQTILQDQLCSPLGFFEPEGTCHIIPSFHGGAGRPRGVMSLKPGHTAAHWGPGLGPPGSFAHSEGLRTVIF